MEGERDPDPESEALFASVILPAYRAEATVGRAVASLLHQGLVPESYEVIVVDDGSPDRTAEVAEEAGARVVRQPNAGPGAARNRGVAESRGGIVVFTDADCEAEPDFLEKMTRPFADATVQGTKGAYLSRQAEVVARLVQIEYESRIDRAAAVQQRHGGIDFIDTYAAAFRREVFDEVGGFEAGLRVGEDQDLSFRLAARGARLRLVSDARVWHLHVDSWRGYAKKKLWIGFWKVAVLRRHPARAVSDSHTPQGIKVEVALAGALIASLLGAGPAAALGAGAAVFLGPLLVLALFLAMTTPFLGRVWRRDRRLLPAAPLFLLIRATALGLGLVYGFLRAPRAPAAGEPAGAGAA